MFVRCKTRRKDGKEHRYWSVVENVRVRGGRVVQRQVLYLGEINDSQRAAWCRTIEVLEGKSGSRQMALFPEGREAPALNCEVVRVQVQDVEVHAPRQWGACWLTLCLWERLELDRFWGPRLPASRQGTRWLDILKVLVCYRLVDPGSEWRLHRQWYEHSALRDLLGCDRVLASNTLYRCLDKLVVHKETFFSFLHERWTRLFDARFDVLLYDLTSTYFESDPPFEDKRQFGYSRDKRSDCVQVVIALIVTPDGFPLAYEVMPGNTSDNTTLAGFLEKIEKQYGRSDRVWIMDRGIPTEATLATMREGDAPVHYLVGTPKGRLTKLEKSFLGQPWQAVRPCVEVKLLAEAGELYILVHSESRVLKERSMRRRRLKKLWQRLHELRHQSNRRDQLLLKLGSAKKEAGRAWHLVDIRVPETGKPVTPETFTFALRRDRLRQARRREGRYLLRSNMTGEDPATLWKYYMRLTEIEQAFKELKHDLAIRPHLPSARRADRGAYLRLFPRLLPARHPEEPRPSTCTRSYSARHLGEVFNHPDGRRPSADYRRPASCPAAPYPGEPGPRTAPTPAWAEVAAAAGTAATSLKSRFSTLSIHSPVVPTFRGQLRKINGLSPL